MSPPKKTKSSPQTSKKKTAKRIQKEVDASSNAKKKKKTPSFREKGVDGTARIDSKVYRNRIGYERMLGQDAWDLTSYHGSDWNCIETLLFGPETTNPEEGFSSAEGLLAKGRPEWVKFVYKLGLMKIEFRKQVEYALEANLHQERLISLDGPIDQLFILDHSIFGDRPEGLDKLVFKQASFLKWFQVLYPALVPDRLISTITPVEERIRLLKNMRHGFHYWVATGEYPKDDELLERTAQTSKYDTTNNFDKKTGVESNPIVKSKRGRPPFPYSSAFRQAVINQYEKGIPEKEIPFRAPVTRTFASNVPNEGMVIDKKEYLETYNHSLRKVRENVKKALSELNADTLKCI